MASEPIENGGDSAQNSPRRRSGFASPEYWSPERREAQRQKARKLNQEGRLGGKQPGAGRPRNKTVAEYVAEEAAKKGDIVWRELYQMLQHKSPSVKLGAIDRINKMEADVQKNMRDDEKMVANLGGKELTDALLEELQGYIDIDPSNVEDVEEVPELGQGKSPEDEDEDGD